MVVAPMNGRYRGRQTSPNPNLFELELRVEADSHNVRISGDFFRQIDVSTPGTSRMNSQFEYSWSCPTVHVERESHQIRISGDVITHEFRPVLRRVEIIIQGGEEAWPTPVASIRFTRFDGTESHYSCAWESEFHRSLELEVDACISMASHWPPQVQTESSRGEPASATARVTSLEEAFQQAGIELRVSGIDNWLDDSGPDFQTWSDAELHHNMTVYYSQHDSRTPWPKWHLWALLAGRHDNATYRGIMFDTFAFPGNDPPRQGFAVFGGHPDFADLPGSLEAQRRFLRTWVHELGHALNLHHSHEAGRPDSLSWMNSPELYDRRHGEGTYWERFRFEFDPVEQRHLRHAGRLSIIPGGEPFAGQSGSADMPGQRLSSPLLELTLHSDGCLEFLEPVLVEVRLRNLCRDSQLEFYSGIEHASNFLSFWIQTPFGQIIKFRPIVQACTDHSLAFSLNPAGTPTAGSERRSLMFNLTFGRDGFYFDQPGAYVLWAQFEDGHHTSWSRPHALRIGHPTSPDLDQLAMAVHDPQLGLNQAIGGSRSPYLSPSWNMLGELAERYPQRRLGLHASWIIATGLARPFSELQKDGKQARFAADFDQALELLNRAVQNLTQFDETQPKGWRRLNNLWFAKIQALRAACCHAQGNQPAADAIAVETRSGLLAQGVKPATVDRVIESMGAVAWPQAEEHSQEARPARKQTKQRAQSSHRGSSKKAKPPSKQSAKRSPRKRS